MSAAAESMSDMMDERELSVYLKNTPRSTIRYWVWLDAIPSIKLGRRRMFLKSEIDKWLKRKLTKVV